jgi:hypothetical protein
MATKQVWLIKHRKVWKGGLIPVARKGKPCNPRLQRVPQYEGPGSCEWGGQWLTLSPVVANNSPFITSETSRKEG